MGTKKIIDLLYSIACLLLCLVWGPSTYGQFAGGGADGHANLRLTNAVCAVTNTNPFIGGSADGHANLRLTNSVCAVTNTNPFTGGTSDGHANLRLTNVVCAVTNVNPYIGGTDDGHANLRLTNIVCPVINTNPYIGGTADGHANLRVVNIVCPITNTNPFIGGNSAGFTAFNVANVSPAQCLSIVLPVELLSFDATLNDDKVDLTWITASETNSDKFYVEKTLDGNYFETVAAVKGAGNSSKTLNYKTLDPRPYPGNSFYRLIQKDLDGRTVVSGLVPISYATVVTALFPNPVTDEREAVLTCTSIYADEMVFSIRDAIGKLVYSTSVVLNPGFNSFALNVQALSNGVYYAELSSKIKKEIIKLVVNK